MQFNVSLDKVNISGGTAQRCAILSMRILARFTRFSLHAAQAIRVLQLSNLAPPSQAPFPCSIVYSHCLCVSAHHSDVASCKGYLILGAEVSPWGWKLHARLTLGGQQAVPIVQGQILKAMWVASSWAN